MKTNLRWKLGASVTAGIVGSVALALALVPGCNQVPAPTTESIHQAGGPGNPPDPVEPAEGDIIGVVDVGTSTLSIVEGMEGAVLAELGAAEVGQNAYSLAGMDGTYRLAVRPAGALAAVAWGYVVYFNYDCKYIWGPYTSACINNYPQNGQSTIVHYNAIWDCQASPGKMCIRFNGVVIGNQTSWALLGCVGPIISQTPYYGSDCVGCKPHP